MKYDVRRYLPLLGALFLGAALVSLAAVDATRGQSGARVLTTLTGKETVNVSNAVTSSVFTTKVAATQGLANAATTVVGSLPTCNAASKGFVYEVTDANGPTYGGTLSGGSTSFALAVCDGSNWTGH